MSGLEFSLSTHKTESFHTESLFIGITTGQERAWLGPEQCPGKTLDVIGKAETGQNIKTRECLAILSSMLRTTCDSQREFDYRGKGQRRSSQLTTWKLKKTNEEKQIHLRTQDNLFRQVQS